MIAPNYINRIKYNDQDANECFLANSERRFANIGLALIKAALVNEDLWHGGHTLDELIQTVKDMDFDKLESQNENQEPMGLHRLGLLAFRLVDEAKEKLKA